MLVFKVRTRTGTGWPGGVIERSSDLRSYDSKVSLLGITILGKLFTHTHTHTHTHTDTCLGHQTAQLVSVTEW